MENKVTVEKRENYLYIKVSGVRTSTKQVMEGSEKIMEIARQYNCNNILADYREVDFQLNLPEAFNIVRIYETTLTDFRNFNLAGLVSKKQLELSEFWESISIKRGFNNKVFLTEEEAIEWLAMKESEKL